MCVCVCVFVPCFISVGVLTLEGGASEAAFSRQRQRAHLCVCVGPACVLKKKKVCVWRPAVKS